MADLVSSDDIRRFAADMRRVDDKTVRSAARKRLKAVADDAVVAAKRSATAMPATVQGKPPLRPLLARAIAAQWRSGGRDIGVSVVVRQSQLPPGRRGAEKVVERGGRHMNWGNPRSWSAQPAKNWFASSISPYVAKAQREMRAVMDDIAKLAGF